MQCNGIFLANLPVCSGVVKDDKDVGKLSKGSLFSFRTSPSTAGGCKNCEDLVARPTRGASWLSSWPSARRTECLKQNSQWRTECAGEILDEMMR